MSSKEPFAHFIEQGRRDPQLRLHKPDQEAEEDAPAPRGPREYRAFEVGQKPPRLDIQCSRGPSHAPAYMLLINVIYDRRFGGSFVLVFNFMVITVTGRNLGEVVYAIKKHRCVEIAEYDPEVFDPPAGEAAVIECIEVQAGAMMESIVNSVGKGKL